MRPKDYKYEAIKKLQALVYNLENSKQDYRLEDLKSLLKESLQGYDDYLQLKVDKNYTPKTVHKSYK
tara:strand:+ start:1017 stop:1217 length:201 start_codon:yes stop_codon:yes gene_type:complete